MVFYNFFRPEETVHVHTVFGERGNGPKRGASLPAAGRRTSTPGLLAEEQRGDRTGQQHDRIQRR